MITAAVPYLHFDGTCEKAFRFYRAHLGGRFEVIHRYDHPHINMPGIDKNKILHAQYWLSDTLMFYGCDLYSNQSLIKGNAEPALSLAFDSESEAALAFRNMLTGGVVLLPFGRQFWGAMHGQLIDQFGIKWMFNKL